MKGKVHYHHEAGLSLAKKELRKAYCSGAKSAALYSANWQLVTCLFCVNKHTRLNVARKKAKLQERLAVAKANIQTNEVAALAEGETPENKERYAKAAEHFRDEVVRLGAALAARDATLAHLAAAGAPDHEENQ